MSVSRERLAEFVQQTSVGTVACRVHGDHHVVAYAEHARRVFRLDEIAHHFVVEVVDFGPFDSLLFVFFLLNGKS